MKRTLLLLGIAMISGSYSAHGDATPSAWGLDWSGTKRTLDDRWFPGQGAFLISADGKVRTNFCESINPNSGIFEDDYWGYPGLPFISPSGEFSDTAAVTVHAYLDLILKFFKSEFHRDSFDDKGSTVTAILHCAGQGKGNAQWTGKYLAFGNAVPGQRDPSSAIDLVAHEFTHGIVRTSSDLPSDAEGGALNEGFADVMGVYAKCKIFPEKCRFTFAEDLSPKGEPLRDLANPAKSDGMDYYSAKAFQQAGDTAHPGSGIPGLAFALLATGGPHPTRGGKPIQGIGIEAAAHLFYSTYTTGLKRNSLFHDLRLQMLEAASRLGSQPRQSVMDTWDALGVQ